MNYDRALVRLVIRSQHDKKSCHGFKSQSLLILDGHLWFKRLSCQGYDRIYHKLSGP